MPEGQITQPIIQPTEIPNPTPVAQKRSNPLLIVVIMLLFFAIIAGAVYLGMKIQERGGLQEVLTPSGPAVNYSSPTSTPTVVPTAIPRVDETSSWKTYISEINKYSIKIPQDWTTDDRKTVFLQIPGDVTFTPPSEMTTDNPIFRTNIAITALKTQKVRYDFNTQQQFDELLLEGASNGEGKRQFKIGNTKVDGLDAIKFVMRPLPEDATEPYYGLVTWIRKDGINYYIELGGDENKVKNLTVIYEKILFTFKFASNQTDETTNWKTYTDSKYNFEFKYSSEVSLMNDEKEVSSLSYIPVCNSGFSACLYYPGKQYADTNFKGAGFSVNVDLNSDSKEKCLNCKECDPETIKEKTINNIIFTTGIRGGAAAGNSSEDSLFRTFYNNKCFEIVERITTDSSDVNTTTKVIKSFSVSQKNNVYQLFDQILSTFKFLK